MFTTIISCYYYYYLQCYFILIYLLLFIAGHFYLIPVVFYFKIFLFQSLFLFHNTFFLNDNPTNHKVKYWSSNQDKQERASYLICSRFGLNVHTGIMCNKLCYCERKQDKITLQNSVIYSCMVVLQRPFCLKLFIRLFLWTL